MKKLVILPNINGIYGKLPNDQLTKDTDTTSSWHDVYLVDSNATITKDCWLVDIYKELIHSSEITIDDITENYIQGVVIASTDVRTKLPEISQVIIDGFLDSNCKNNVVETMEFGDGNYTVMLVSEFENEWANADLSLNLTEL